jgi:hypothetical protein
MTQTQIGSCAVVKRPIDAAKAEIDVRDMALKQIQREGWTLLGDVRVMHLSELSEDDWYLMSVALGEDLGPWQPGHEVWGWRAEAER